MLADVYDHLVQYIAEYRRLANFFEQKIRSGELPPDHKLPTGAALAAEFNVSPATVQRAIGLLHDRGLIYSKQGKGVYVAPIDQD